MSNLINVTTAKALVSAGAVNSAEIIGIPGGWTIQLATPTGPKMLVTKEGKVQRLSSFESCVEVLRTIGLHTMLRVDPSHWATKEALSTRKRSDRSAAMKLEDADARYVAFLRDAVEVSRADPRPSLSAEDAARYMVERRELHRGQLSAKLGVEIRLDDGV